jgi:hypothetical protein
LKRRMDLLVRELDKHHLGTRIKDAMSLLEVLPLPEKMDVLKKLMTSDRDFHVKLMSDLLGIRDHLDKTPRRLPVFDYGTNEGFGGKLRVSGLTPGDYPKNIVNVALTRVAFPAGVEVAFVVFALVT